MQMSRIPFQHVATLLDHLSSQLQADLGRNVVGLYVYGSLTQNAFDVRLSDVDCVAVIRRRLTSAVVSRPRSTFGTLNSHPPCIPRPPFTTLIPPPPPLF